MNKKKLLAWGDSPTASTGFGTVSKYIITALHASGMFEIDQLAINYHGNFVSKEEVPWQLVPAKLADPNDPYGSKMFLRSISERDYDYIWILNDTFVVHQVAKDMRAILDKKKEQNKTVAKVVFYYPVDCRIIPEMSDMLKLCDIPVAYNQFGKDETIKELPDLADKIKIIHHGTDTQIYKPFSKEIIKGLKEKYFGYDTPKYIVMNVNRNSPRKQIAKTMLAFSEFKKKVPDSILYIHAMAQDKDIDLIVAAKHLGLRPKDDLVFPPNYSPSYGYPAHVLNELYNCGDMFLTTHLGEGWGLTVTEAMAAGVPVVAPNNTSMPDILGEESQRGFLYQCNDQCYIDNSGYRKFATTDVIVNKMLEVYNLEWKHNLKQVVFARKWVDAHNWGSACSLWLTLFRELEEQKVSALQENTPSCVGELL